MNEKCTKYEGLFIFSDEEALRQHIAECEDCRLEQEKMDKVSDLIGEVKSHYKSKSRRKPMMKIACAFAILIFSVASITVADNYDDMLDTLRYGDTLSAEELGFPVDSYGFIAVDE